MSCLLWEDNFYEDGVSIADRITSLVKNCIDKGHYDDVIDILKTVKFDMRLRHCPLWMIVAIYKAGKTIDKSQYHSGTYMWDAISTVEKVHYDRLIVITDE